MQRTRLCNVRERADQHKRLKPYSGVGIFRTTFGIQVEAVCLAVCSFLNIDVNDSLMTEQVICLKLLLICNRLLFTILEGRSSQVVI